MKLICITCLYKRPRVSAIFFTGMARMGIPVVAGVSTAIDVELAHKFGVRTVVVENSPLGRKWNTTIAAALDYHPDVTHLMISGDDDLYAPMFLPMVQSSHARSKPFIGCRSMFMVEPSTGKAIRFEYEKDIAIGSGRVFMREVLEKLRTGEGKINMFEDHLERGLDHYADLRLYEVGRYRPFLLPFAPMIGVKTSDNMWPLENFNGETVDFDGVLSDLPYHEQEMIRKLK